MILNALQKNWATELRVGYKAATSSKTSCTHLVLKTVH